MRTETVHRKLYVHETTHLRAGTIGRFAEEFSNHHKPLMEGLGARVFGIWQGNPLYVPWSERTGKLRLGSFTTYLRNEEVIHYWAIEGGWDGFSKFFPAFMMSGSNTSSRGGLAIPRSQWNSRARAHMKGRGGLFENWPMLAPGILEFLGRQR